MDFSFSISERLALELLNKKYGNMLNSVTFQNDVIEVEAHVMLSALKIGLRILEINPEEGITIEFLSNGLRSFMLKKAISGFYEKFHLEKTDKDNVYKYSWKNFLVLLKDYRKLLTSSTRIEIHCKDGIFKLDFFLS
jgi:hypothetical protein